MQQEEEAAEKSSESPVQEVEELAVVKEPIQLSRREKKALNNPNEPKQKPAEVSKEESKEI